ncbi:MAG TPA: hypothetical protein PKA28_17695 [Methylomusa anaerophila]|uniref:hypothetical protein n=1 Tax=Methylomusa anaerophila TaxID=1930071 RepID=UPI001E54BF9A|nr:hypothetical protein [Methylomusa anaerophila]HML90278.1 hypothetical protein [Methylomusa anaerophila]
MGYIKAAALSKAIYLSAVPTEIYTPVALLIFGATFFVTTLIVPLTIFSTLYIFRYLVSGEINNKIKIWFDQKNRIFLWGTFLTIGLIEILTFTIPGGSAILPLLITVKYPIAGLFLILTLLFFVLVSFWVIKKITSKERWVYLGLSVFIWMSAMLLIQISMYRPTMINADLPIDTQRPGVVGSLTIKDNIKQSWPSPDFSGGYVLEGMLLFKSDKLYYFAVFPRNGSNVSSLYMFPEDRVIAFNTSILLLEK